MIIGELDVLRMVEGGDREAFRITGYLETKMIRDIL